MVGGQAEVLGQVQRLFDAGGLGGLPDSALLARFVERRDAAAFEALVSRHGPTVLRVCRGVLGTGGDADDAFQATFLVLARKAQALEGNDSISLWLFEVARRVATRARGDAARRARIERNAAKEAVWLPEPEHDRADLEAALIDEVRRLPEVYRAAIVLCYWQGLSYELAASRLGVPESTVRGRLARGRRRLRDRLTRRGFVLPAAGWLAAGAGKSTRAAVSTRLVDAAVHAAIGAPGGRVVLLTEAVLRSLFMTRLTIATAALVLVGGGLVSLRIALAEPPAEAEPPVAKSQAAPTPRAPEPTLAPPGATRPIDEPKLELAPNPAPWKTVVRVKVQGDHAVGFGSGTVIQSTAESSLILTCAHIFKVNDDRSAPPRRITVDLFDGQLREGERAQVHYAESVGAEVVDLDPGLDVGLIRIRPGHKLPASPVVPSRWRPDVGMKMTTAGCSEGNDATFWTTQIINPIVRGLANSPHYEAIECRHAPKQGRTGGGLFTSDGYVAGVCNFAEPGNDRGLYAAPASIHRMLDRNQSQSIHEERPALGNAPPPVVPKGLGTLALERSVGPTSEGTVLFLDDDRRIHTVQVEYRPGDPWRVRVLVPSTWNLGNAWQAYQVTPGGLCALQRSRIVGGTQVELAGPFNGTATVILAEDPRTLGAILEDRLSNRQDTTLPERDRTPRGR